MSIKLYGILFCAMCAIHPMVCGATTFITVPDGAEISMTGVSKETITVNGQSVENSDGRALVAAGDATITVAYPSGKTSGALSCGLVVTNGTVTLDLTAIDGKSFTLANGAIAKGNGTLRVKGCDSISMGRTINAYTATTLPPVDVQNVEYVDSAGVAYASPEGLILTNGFLECSLPTTTPWKLAANAVPALVFAGSQIAQSLVSGTVLQLEARTYRLQDQEAVPAGVESISIPSGGELIVMAVGPNIKDYYSAAGTTSMSISNDIAVAAGGTLCLNSRYSLNMTGAISGAGALKSVSWNPGTGNVRTTTIYDASAFTGSVSCEGDGITLAFKGASPGAGGNDVTLLEGRTLKLGTDAANGYSGSIGTVTGPSSGAAASLILPASEGSYSIAALSGNVDVTGAGYDKTIVELGSFEVGDVVAVDGGSVHYTLSPAALAQPGISTFTRTNGRNVYARFASSSYMDYTGIETPDQGAYTLVAADGATYARLPTNVCLVVGAGVSAAIETVSGEGTPNVRMEGGSLTVSRYLPETWRNKIMYWMDPSVLSSAVINGVRTVSSTNYPVAEGMNDVRETQTAIKLIRCADPTSTWPTLMTNAVNGLTYLSCDYGGNRRLRFESAIAPKFAIVVFGSQLGGGQAVLGNTSGFYKRGGTLEKRMTADNPIFTTNIATWINGTLVDPTVTNLSGGWEIISVDASKAVVHGLGFNAAYGTTSNIAGQNYGEVLLFSETPTELERIAAEKYLAEKWGVSGYNDAGVGSHEVRADGTGTISIGCEASLSGAFSGTVALNGNTLTTSDESLPPGDEVVVSDGRLAWFDPDKRDSINLGSDGKSIFNIYDRERGKTDGAPVLNSAGRTPSETVGPRGFGPSRRWVDYRDTTYYGRVLRLNKYPATTSRDIEPLSARTVFLVQDSSKSGGSPFLTVINGDSGDILSRLASGMAPDPGAPIWRSTTANIFASGATYLDGREVDGAVDGFYGRPELLTAVGGRAFNVGAFAYYYYPASLTNANPNVDVGEIQGEILVYDCVLSEETRKGIEAYLMWKWLGTARDGYSVMTNITVSGDGQLNVGSVAQMPKIGSSFTGTLAFSETSFDFTVTAEGTVEGALSGGSGTLALPAACTANVTLERGVPPGEYALVSGAIAPGTDWTLNLVAASSRLVSLEVRGGTPFLIVQKRGAVFTIR